MRYLTASYIFPIHEAPVANGILVLDENGTVTGLLDPESMDHDLDFVERYEGVLCPGFVNAHCHLELSAFKGKIEAGKGLDHFLRDLDVQRKQVNESQVMEAIEEAAEEMLLSGTVAVGDVSNTPVTAAHKASSPIFYHTFCEVFGSDPVKAAEVFRLAEELLRYFQTEGCSGQSSITPHATYSLSRELFQRITNHAVLNHAILSIHHQENEDENRFFLDGSGAIAERRMHFNPGIEPFHGTGKRPLESISSYLDPGRPVQWVHNTFSKQEDLAFALEYFLLPYWCLCPNANLYIENRLPEIHLFRKAGCNITLGTDSLASNHSLSLLEEMKTISRQYPEIPLCELLAWGTANGAEFLGFRQLGTFEKGKRPGIVLIEGLDLQSLTLLPGSRSKLLIMHGNDSIHQQ